MDNRNTEIENGYSGFKNGWRQIAFNSKGEIRDVSRKHSTGRPSRRRTVQEIVAGDIVIRSDWTISCRYGTISIATATLTASVVTDNGYIRLLEKKETDQYLESFITPQIAAFLRPVSSASASFLPPGCGWNGEYTNKEEAAFQSAKEFFKDLEDKQLTFRIAKFACCTHWLNEVDTWEAAANLPDTFAAHDNDETTEHYLIVWNPDGTVFALPMTTPIATAPFERVVHLKFFIKPNADRRCGVTWRCYRRM